MSRETQEDRVPDLRLERYYLGEMPAVERASLERALEHDTELRRRLEEIARSDAEIRRRYPPEWLAERVRERQPKPDQKRRPSWVQAWPVPAAVAVVAIVLVALVPRAAGPPASEPSPVAESDDRIKGLEPGLSLHRKTADGTEVLAEGAVVRAGELVRIGYRSAGRPYGVVLSLDGRGAVTLHLPVAGERAVRLRSGETVLLDRAYELDDAPRWECFYLVTAQAPFDVAPVLDAARRAAGGMAAARPPRLALPSALEQSAFFVVKGERP